MDAIFGEIMKFIAIILSPVLLAVIVFVLSYGGWFLHYRLIKKMKVPVSEFPAYRAPGILKRIFWMFPKQLIDDLFHRDPDEFKEYGLHMFCGEQGAGKTTAVVELLVNRMKKRYPRSKIRTNMNFRYQDGPINHWEDLVQNENGIYGQIEVLDEIQTWFSSLQSKNFPPEMLTEISQQRKQRKMLVGTAQVYSRIAKPIREQTTFVYLPVTIMGCLTWVRVSKPRYWDDEKQTFKHYIKHYFFIHTKEVRDAFDTYEKIEKYKKEGFKDDKIRTLSDYAN
ncbi:hypothetical protein [Lysinibacillus capsici]|uniref:hypothetical protein n=1 Tax=Lysinibacillus capsici TaxID=2115968 RepID=UPI0028B170B3|nr:hypothetical protein [Lysinibacillus capsici]